MSERRSVAAFTDRLLAIVAENRSITLTEFASAFVITEAMADERDQGAIVTLP